MIRRQSIQQPSWWELVRESFISDDDQFDELKPIGDKEFYSVLAILVAGVVLLALTIGPIAIL